MTVSPFGAVVPTESNTIIMWDEPISEIPNGWVICDGNNGTPNLLDRMPKMVPDGSTDPGATGGTDSASMSSSQMPSHSHTGSTSGGGHGHSYGVNTETYDYGESGPWLGGSGDSTTSDSAGSHSHTGSLNSTGSGSALENRPEYYEVAYIMKT